MRADNSQLPIVALVGRPNVGKSTLFNRLAAERIAIVESFPGVTRDRLYAPANWTGHEFLLVDTGGITDKRDSLSQQVTSQALLAMREADVIVFLVDARAGLLPPDKEIGERLRRIGKPVLLVANKAEHQPAEVVDFYELGLGEAMTVSAEHGLGLGDVLDKVVASLPKPGAIQDHQGIAVAVVGRPNVGKSSLVNALLGADRVIISDEPGTTRDAIDTHLVQDGVDFTLIDTAGIRRAARVDEPVEYYGVLRAIRAMERSEVVLLLLSANDPATMQDQRIAGLILQAGKACAIVVNKWDLMTGKSTSQAEVKEQILDAMQFLQFAPVQFISVRTGLGISRIMPAVSELAAEYARRIPTARLNEVLNEAVLVHEPPTHKGRKLRLFYATQVRTKPPVIQIHVNHPELVHFSYQRYLENRLREAFGFQGTPLRLHFKARTGRRSDT